VPTLGSRLRPRVEMYSSLNSVTETSAARDILILRLGSDAMRVQRSDCRWKTLPDMRVVSYCWFLQLCLACRGEIACNMNDDIKTNVMRDKLLSYMP
jgi:hypothetical protein